MYQIYSQIERDCFRIRLPSGYWVRRYVQSCNKSCKVSWQGITVPPDLMKLRLKEYVFLGKDTCIWCGKKLKNTMNNNPINIWLCCVGCGFEVGLKSKRLGSYNYHCRICGKELVKGQIADYTSVEWNVRTGGIIK